MSFPRYEKYKDSGVEWLGKVPAHWGVSQARRMFAVRSEPAAATDKMLTASQKYGVLFQSDFVEREGRRVVEVIMGTESLKHVEPDDFIISMRSFQGGIEWCKLRGSTSFHYVMLKPVKHVYPPYFAHLLKSATYIQALRTTTNLIRDGQELRYSNFVQVDLPLVPMEEQAAVATFLDHETAKIDALVEEQKRLIELLKEKRQAVISHAVTKGLNPRAPMKDSGVEWLGEVPAHWEVKSIRYILNSIGDVDHFMPLSVESGVPYLMTGDLKEFVSDVRLEDCKQVSRSDYLQLSKKIRTSKGDVVMARYATIGTLMYVDVDVDILVSYSCVTLKTNPSKMSGMYLFQYMKSNPFRWSIEIQTNTNTQGNVGIKDLQDLKVMEPPANEQAAIVTFLHHETAKINRLTAEANSVIDLLQERRTALISAAVTGKIDVRSKLKQLDPALA
jgi:type I restriction enzyme S subunit